MSLSSFAFYWNFFFCLNTHHQICFNWILNSDGVSIKNWRPRSVLYEDFNRLVKEVTDSDRKLTNSTPSTSSSSSSISTSTSSSSTKTKTSTTSSRSQSIKSSTKKNSTVTGKRPREDEEEKIEPSKKKESSLVSIDFPIVPFDSTLYSLGFTSITACCSN